MKRCPECGSARAWELADGRSRCRVCGKRYRAASAWVASRLSERTKHRLLEWFVLGVPVYRQRFRGVASAPATERFYRLIRACMAYDEQLREPFAGELECDETTFGGVRPGKRGWGARGKVIVFGVIKRNGQVKAMPIAAHSRAAMMAEIQAHTREGSLYYTDEWQAYATLRLRGDHVIIRKHKGGQRDATTSTASRASGATPRTGSILTGACRQNTSIFTWEKCATGTTTATRTLSPC